MKILVIHTYGLGDMVMATPALALLRERLPEAKIDLLVFQNVSSMPLEVCTDGFSIIHASFNMAKLIKTIMRLRRMRYDYILHTSGTDPVKMAIFMALVGGKYRIAEAAKREVPWIHHAVENNEKIHRVEANLRLVKPVVGELTGGFTRGPIFCLEPSDARFAESFLKKHGLSGKRVIGIHPGCNEKFSYKRWSVQKYADLIGRVYDRYEDVEILLFAGPDEEKEARLLKEAHSRLVVVQEHLRRVAALIRTLDLMITNDSGLGHIASCFETKVVTIFSKESRADPSRIAPYTKRSIVVDLRKKKCEDEVSCVMEAVNGCWSQC
ncbi:glycosyltransferase family 9 protein [Hydrogenimonas sp.]